MSTLHDRLHRRWAGVLDELPGTFSVSLRGLDGFVVDHHAGARHYAASTIKVAVLAAFLQACTSGAASWDEPVDVHARFASEAGGWFELAAEDDQDPATWACLGAPLPWSVLAERMITVSSNIATDLIVERIGITSVQRFLVEAELAAQLSFQRLIGDAAAHSAGLTNAVTADGLTALFVGLANADWLSLQDSATALEILSRQEHLDGIAAGLPPGTWQASKSGWVPGVRHDVALVRPAGAAAYALAVCTTSEVPDADAVGLIADISRITYQEWCS
ncbi:MAG: class A beta-lactamase-related serine hydrolase [Propionibacteriales bacterium]|nr:class A beta-lactamase-related serine hydrolase [Propionibacteriales bacterium]